VRAIWTTVLVLLLALSAAGCGTSDDRAAARGATERFYAAVGDGDGAAACEELSAATVTALEGESGQACAEAVTGLEYTGGSVAGVEVYVTNAKVDLDGGESAFLAPESGAWKLSAVGCRPEDGEPRDRPLECEVES
jgi:hypothetical protein